MLTKPGPKHTLQTAETALDQPEELTKKRIQHRNCVSRLVSRFYSQNIRIIIVITQHLHMLDSESHVNLVVM